MASKSSDEVRSNQESKTDLCAQCMCNSKETLAVFYCFDCEDKFYEGCGNWHRTSKASKDHRLWKVEEAPPSDVAQLIQKLTICPNHPSEKVVCICLEEDNLCCNQCVIQYHRKCNHLYTIEQCVQQNYAPEKVTPPSRKFSKYDLFNQPVYIEMTSQVKMGELNDCCKRISDGLIALENEIEHIITREASLQADLTRSADQVKAYLQDVHATLESAFITLEKQLMD
ncbi:hypothetical protein DPMN_112080 [Dreissena polymorpha]|uniref:B box-type domain-containing protein n=1 Tax=Dreissena polymorpha TaxID=45954 RepID=A0A9D4KF01_DREPO|nr:hypothetical protein DPMN_112080 [Dreissena polymorpha]